ncbi:MAG TPA: putative cobaltochelatase [Dehalococcoidia bacterium]|nr:putative cobaltochelatase [Dehalococcoidia bacterium]
MKKSRSYNLEKNTLQPVFPFTAIVGQERMKKALILNAINPSIGGVLIRGNKGTAKSTAVRSLSILLPNLELINRCQFNCFPDFPQDICEICNSSDKKDRIFRPVKIVQLPVGATEDRLVGSLNIEEAIKTGNRVFEPGLLAGCNKGILYIDEVNLLNDHLVDVLLDAAAMGRNYVEREGVSITHESQFMLIGTMNPEEGDLRPQLLDRFGLAVEVESEIDAEDRIEVVKRRIRFETHPHQFITEWEKQENLERNKIQASRQILSEVEMPDDMLYLISTICADFGIDGLRGDIVMYKTSITLAAYEQRKIVTPDDVREAAVMALLHRQRRQPFQQPNLDQERLDDLVNQENISQNNNSREQQDSSDGDASGSEDPGPSQEDNPSDEDKNSNEENMDSDQIQEEIFDIGALPNIKSLDIKASDNLHRSESGRRAKTNSSSGRGYYVSATLPKGKITDLALDATLRAAAPHQKSRQLDNVQHPAVIITKSDLREKVRLTQTGTLIIFVVDGSGSMGAQRRMSEVKGAVMSLLLDAYQRRDTVAMVVFRKEQAELILPPTNSVELAQNQLQYMPTGGRTPLTNGLLKTLDVINMEGMKDRNSLPFVVLLSDGRNNVGSSKGHDHIANELTEVCSEFKHKKIKTLVIDTESGFVKLELAKKISQDLGGEYVTLDEFASENLVKAINQNRNYEGM